MEFTPTINFDQNVEIFPQSKPNHHLKNNFHLPEKWKREYIPSRVTFFILIHITALYGAYLAITSAKLATTCFAFSLYVLTLIGVTAGSHRLFSHRSYKASAPFKIFILAIDTIGFQYPAIKWAKVHRLHHRFSETDADPHNAKRGFFFAHIGWLMTTRHPLCVEKNKEIDVSDLTQDRYVMFQYKYYLVLVFLACYLMPTVVPMYFWGESLRNAFFVAVQFRHVFALHIVWTVNSFAHFYGNKPYDKAINPSNNVTVSAFTFGEGFHNYHHTFPWDYRADELNGSFSNLTTILIDIAAYLGLVYDRKKVSPEKIRERVLKTGDTSHPLWKTHEEKLK